MNKTELLWSLYLSERDFLKHHENNRAKVSSILSAISAGLIVAYGNASLDVYMQFIISILLIVIGFFGISFCNKLTALCKMHAVRSYSYLKAIDDDVMSNQIQKIKDDAKKKTKESFPKSFKIQLNKIWKMYHFFILVTGVFLFGLNLYLFLEPNLAQ